MALMPQPNLHMQQPHLRLNPWGPFGLPLLLSLLLSLDTGSLTVAQPTASGEYLLKAAFLYNFAKFVEWPETSFADGQAPLTLCVLGQDPFGSALDALTEKSIKGRPLHITRLSQPSNAGDCHILFIDRTEIPHTHAILSTLNVKAILTVCDDERCAQQGMMINLRTVNDKIQMEMNVEAIQRTPLKVSSQLIKLAHVIKENR